MRYEPSVIWDTSFNQQNIQAIAANADSVFAGGYSGNWLTNAENNTTTYWTSGSVIRLDSETGQLAWSVSVQPFSQYRYTQVNDIAVADDDSIYVVGTSRDLDGSSGSYDGFLAKIGQSGDVLWTKVLENSNARSGDGLNAVALGPNNEIYVGGYTRASLPYLDYSFVNGSSVPSETSPRKVFFGEDKALLAEFVDAGSTATLQAWSLAGGDDWGPDSLRGSTITSLAISDDGGSLYAAGVKSNNNGGLFVSRQPLYDSEFYEASHYLRDGSYSGEDYYKHFYDYHNYPRDASSVYWQTPIDGSGWAGLGADLALDSLGNVYVYGDIWSGSSTGGYDLYLAQLSQATGSLGWLQQFGSSSDQYASSLAVGGDGLISVAGQSVGPLEGVNLDGFSFLSQFSATGEQQETAVLDSWWSAALLASAPEGKLYSSDGYSLSLIDPSQLQPVPETPALFSYRLLTDASASAVEVTNMEVYAFGDLDDQSRRYYLEISADTGLSGEIGLASVDLTLGFNPYLFKDIVLADVDLGDSPLSQLQKISIDNDAGQIRFVAGSAEAIQQDGQSLGSAIRERAVLGYIAFDLDDEALTSLIENEGYYPGTTTRRSETAGFSLSANLDETIFTDLESLREKQQDELNYSTSGPAAKALAVTMNLTQQRAHQFGTQRLVSLAEGELGFTNLIREGDTVVSSAAWKNTGDMGITGIQYHVQQIANAQINVSQSFSDIGVGTRYPDGTIYDPNRPSRQVVVSLQATGSAGSVVDTSAGAYTITESSSWFDWVGKGGKNLITYQGDLNYDGRVSMKDLAFLNAGATLKNSTGVVAGDVDADHDGDFTIADLEVLDRQWGQSLHTGVQTFQGQTQTDSGETTTVLSWDQLSAQTVVNEQGAGMSMQWDNANFEAQNAIESSGFFEPALQDGMLA